MQAWGPLVSDDVLQLIDSALDAATDALRPYTPGSVETSYKLGDDPVTQADLAVDRAIKEVLTQDGTAWLSEETADDPLRLEADRVWIVDPLDGTREFVRGIPEWCVSIGLVVEGVPVAGGVLAPAADQRFLGGLGCGVTLNGRTVEANTARDLRGILVLASRSEVARGQWDPYFSTDVSIRTMGSVAYKLALVAAGLADATWSLAPKNEWDVAGGAALVKAAAGRVSLPDGTTRRFNSRDTLMPGIVATGAEIHDAALELMAEMSVPTRRRHET